MKTIPHSITAFTEEKYPNEGAMVALAAIASLPMLNPFAPLSHHFLRSANPFTATKG